MATYKPGKQHYTYERGGRRASATFNLKRSGLKEKDLIGISWRAALALQQPWLTCQECGTESHESQWVTLHGQWRVCPSCEQLTRWEITEPGWYLRADVIWHKPNALPDSVKDRPVTDHKYIFLLAKSPRYHFDYEVLKEDTADSSKRSKRTVWSVNTAAYKGPTSPCFHRDSSRRWCSPALPREALSLTPSLVRAPPLSLRFSTDAARSALKSILSSAGSRANGSASLSLHIVGPARRWRSTDQLTMA